MATFVGFCMEFLRIFLTFTRPVSDKILDILYKIFIGATKPLPPIDDKILLLTATEIADRIRKRKLKAETVMKSYIRRIKDVEPLINACVDERFDDALADAREVDNLLETSDKSAEMLAKEMPLLGVPFTCKEAIGVKDMTMSDGVVLYKDHKAPADAETVSLLRKAGAIPVTVTNVPVYCMWWESANQAFGMTRNPYDNSRTVGGSSGGEGAIITAAGALFGIGSDVAGSIRIPSSFCGIYGHKPSRGVISIQRSWPPLTEKAGDIMRYVSYGPMCRYVQDLTLLTEVLAGDTASKLKLHQKVNFSNVKIYYIEEFPGCLLKSTSDIKAAIRKAAKHFENEFGNKATELRLEELRDAFTIWECKLLESGCGSFESLLAKDEPINLFAEFVKSLIQCSDYTWPALYFATVDRRDKDQVYVDCLQKYNILKEKFDNIFKEDAILLVPTHPEPPPHYLMTIPKYPNIAYTCIFNILGYPSSQVPVGLSNGVPIGIQVVSSTFQDHLTLAAAEELDKVFRGWISPCSINV